MDNLREAINRSSELFDEGKYNDALMLLRSRLDDVRAANEVGLLLDALLNIGATETVLRNHQEAHRTLEEGLQLARKAEKLDVIASFEHELALLTFQEGDLAASEAHCYEAISLRLQRPYRKIRKGFVRYFEYDLAKIGREVLHLSVLRQAQGDFTQASEFLRLLRANCERTYDGQLLGKVLHELALTSAQLGDLHGALLLFLETIRTRVRVGDSSGIALTLTNLRAVARLWPSDMTAAGARTLLEQMELELNASY